MSDEHWDDLDDFLLHAERDALPKIRDSALYCAIQPHRTPDPKFSLELGAAIMFYKPILVIAVEGRTVPPGPRRIAHRVAEAPSMDAGKDRFLAAIREMLGELP